MANPWIQKLKDPRWQKTRLEILDAHKWTCDECGDTNKTLHIHHGYYSKNIDPWDYPQESLHCLCDECHAALHERLAQITSSLGYLTATELDNILGFIIGYRLTGTLESYTVDDYEIACGITNTVNLLGRVQDPAEILVGRTITRQDVKKVVRDSYPQLPNRVTRKRRRSDR
jgi:hypothetical protein